MKFLVILMLSLLIVACGKDVSSQGNPDVKITPNPNNPPGSDGNGGGTGIAYDGTITATFSNHSGFYTSRTVSSNMVITLPLTVQITYETSPSKPRLDLVLNNQYLCSYVYTAGKYQVNANCDLTVMVYSGDILTLFGTPDGETVTLKVNYQNQ